MRDRMWRMFADTALQNGVNSWMAWISKVIQETQSRLCLLWVTSYRTKVKFLGRTCRGNVTIQGTFSRADLREISKSNGGIYPAPGGFRQHITEELDIQMAPTPKSLLPEDDSHHLCGHGKWMSYGRPGSRTSAITPVGHVALSMVEDIVHCIERKLNGRSCVAIFAFASKANGALTISAYTSAPLQSYSQAKIRTVSKSDRLILVRGRLTAFSNWCSAQSQLNRTRCLLSQPCSIQSFIYYHTTRGSCCLRCSGISN